MAKNDEFKLSEQDFQSIDVNALSSSEGKSIGPEHVGLEAMKQLGFFKLFRQLKFERRTMHLAALLIIGRLVHPSSERELKRYAEEESGLDELLQSDFSQLATKDPHRYTLCSIGIILDTQAIICNRYAR